MPKSDKELEKAVLRELEWDSRANRAAIDTAVAGGVVTLHGTVDGERRSRSTCEMEPQPFTDA